MALKKGGYLKVEKGSVRVEKSSVRVEKYKYYPIYYICKSMYNKSIKSREQ